MVQVNLPPPRPPDGDRENRESKVPILLIEAIFISLRSDGSCWLFHPHLVLSAFTLLQQLFSGSNAIAGMSVIGFILACGLEVYL